VSILNKNARLHCVEGEHCEHVGWQHRGRHSTFDWLGRVHRSELSAALAHGKHVHFYFAVPVPFFISKDRHIGVSFFSLLVFRVKIMDYLRYLTLAKLLTLFLG
jgi:hypothetical protein